MQAISRNIARLKTPHRQRQPHCVGVLILLCTALAACQGRPGRRSEPSEKRDGLGGNRPHLAVWDLRNGVPERASDSLFANRSDENFAQLVVANDQLLAAPQAKALFVRLGFADLPLERAAEVGQLLAKHRQGQGGKGGVVCHADMLSNATLALAARGCDEVWLSDAGAVDSVGIAGQLIFGKALFDRLHADVDFLQVGKFKGASEPFTRESSSPEARSSLQTTLAQLRESWLGQVLADRKSTHAKPEDLEDGPYSAKAAKARGLIDRIGFEDDAMAAARKRAATQEQQTYFGGSQKAGGPLSNVLRQLASANRMRVPHVAVVQANGAIRMGSDGGLAGGGGITRDKLSSTLAKLRRNRAVRAVVVRMDSPGGSALASDLLWHEVMKLREKKPVVVSVGGMAASGGYYIASAASHIVAHPLSIVGSIGVVAGKVSFRRSLARIGVNVETVTARKDDNPRALYGSPFVRWDEATRKRLLGGIENAYSLFLARISTGRNTTPAALKPAAEGRIMGGKRALELGLVDTLGTLSDAIAKARTLAKLPAKTPVRVIVPKPGLLNLFADDDETAAAQKPQRVIQQALRSASLAGGLLDPQGPLAMYRAQIYDFFRSMAPLVEGEHVSTALPFILIVK